MTQTFTVPTSGTALSTDVGNISACLETLRSNHSGTSRQTTPTPVAGETSYDTSTKLWYVYDGSTWNATQHGQVRADRYITTIRTGALSATTTFTLVVAKGNQTVERVILSSSTATTSNGTDHWTIQVANVTASLNLRSASFDTNGNELSATAYKNLALDQNLNIADADVLRITFTKNGSATALADCLIQTEAVPR